MPSLHTFGKVVTASSQAEAKELFRHRKELGIGGVIFTPDIIIPKWARAERKILGQFVIEMLPDIMQPIGRSREDRAWEEIAGETTRQIIELSKEFNTTNRTRRVWYIENDELNTTFHCDEAAVNGFVHIHGWGDGMVYCTPMGDEPVQVLASNEKGDRFDAEDLKRLYLAGKIRTGQLEEGQAAVFDHTMVHLSGKGNRFRIVTLG